MVNIYEILDSDTSVLSCQEVIDVCKNYYSNSEILNEFDEQELVEYVTKKYEKKETNFFIPKIQNFKSTQLKRFLCDICDVSYFISNEELMKEIEEKIENNNELLNNFTEKAYYNDETKKYLDIFNNSNKNKNKNSVNYKRKYFHKLTNLSFYSIYSKIN